MRLHPRLQDAPLVQQLLLAPRVVHRERAQPPQHAVRQAVHLRAAAQACSDPKPDRLGSASAFCKQALRTPRAWHCDRVQNDVEFLTLKPAMRSTLRKTTADILSYARRYLRMGSWLNMVCIRAQATVNAAWLPGTDNVT